MPRPHRRRPGRAGRGRGRRPFPGGLPAVHTARWGAALLPVGYAVVDVETTGLRPRQDRVVEVAVVRTDPTGQVLDEWSTLVDPGCDPGPSDVHGITAGALLAADPFAAVAPELTERLRGHVLVGHNLAFDAAFLAAEAHRLATLAAPVHRGTHATAPTPVVASLRAPVPLLDGVPAGLCTLQLSRAVLPRPPDGWSLGSLCTQVGVPLHDAHRALADARATAGVLAALLAELPARARPLGRRLVVG